MGVYPQGRHSLLDPLRRRLPHLGAVDVMGYSRLMGRDEDGTLSRLKAHRTERLEPVLTRHGGRLVKLTGDGAPAEFPSAVDARWAPPLSFSRQWPRQTGNSRTTLPLCSASACIWEI